MGSANDKTSMPQMCPHVRSLTREGFAALLAATFPTDHLASPPRKPSLLSGQEPQEHNKHNKHSNRRGSRDSVEAGEAVSEGQTAWEKEYAERRDLAGKFQCGTCSTRPATANAERLKQALSGAVCYDKLWSCMHCATLACLDQSDDPHVWSHCQQTDHPLVIQCHDSHVFCTICAVYVYPRELAGSSIYDELMDGIVYEWLLFLGHLRLWWRKMAAQPSPGSRGIKNFGNTCFFTSTCQALLHTKQLRTALCNFRALDDEELPIQRELSLFTQRYFGEVLRPLTMNPRGLFQALQDNALFGNYADRTMEDSSSLMLDLLGGLDPQLVSTLFNTRLSSNLNCSCGWTSKHAAAPETMLSLPLETEGDIDSSTQPTEGPREGGGAAVKRSTKYPHRRKVLEDMRLGWQEQAPLQLREIINNFFQQQAVPDFRCDKCKLKGGVRKQMQALGLPPVLVLQLKRFAQRRGRQIKCHRRVLLPKRLDLQHLVAEDKQQEQQAAAKKGKQETQKKQASKHEDTQTREEDGRKKSQRERPLKQGQYQLSAMVVHDGGLGGGHNMCYVRQPSEVVKWSWFSDADFGPVTEAEVNLAEPYLLFYEET